VSEGADGYDGNRQHHKGHRGEFSYRRGGRGQFRRGRGGRGGYNNQRYQQLEDSEEAGGDGAVGVRIKPFILVLHFEKNYGNILS
jgi:hypothetical protein